MALRRQASGDTNCEPLRSSSDEEEDVENGSSKPKRHSADSAPNLYDDNLNLEQFNLNEWHEVEQTLLKNGGVEYVEPTTFNTNIDHTLEKRFDPLDDSDANVSSIKETAQKLYDENLNEDKSPSGQNEDDPNLAEPTRVSSKVQSSIDTFDTENIEILKENNLNNKIIEDVKNEATLLEIEDLPVTERKLKFPVKVERSINDVTFPVTESFESDDFPSEPCVASPKDPQVIIAEIIKDLEKLSLDSIEMNPNPEVVVIEEKLDIPRDNVETQTEDDGSAISDTVLLKNYKNQTEHSCKHLIGPEMNPIDIIETNDSNFICATSSQDSIINEMRPGTSKLRGKKIKKDLELPSPWKELWMSSSSEDSSDSDIELDEVIHIRPEIRTTEPKPFTEHEDSITETKAHCEDSPMLCEPNNPINLELQNDSSEDEIIECIESHVPLKQQIIPETVELEESSEKEESDIEECISMETSLPVVTIKDATKDCSLAHKHPKEKEEVWEIDLHDHKINCMEKSPSELSLVSYEPRTPCFDFSKEPKDKLFLINKLLQSGTNLTFGMDNTLTVGGVLEVTDVERLQAETFKERSDKLQKLCDRIYARRDEINARFDKIQALWGDFKNPYKGMEKKPDRCSQGTSTDTENSLDKTVDLKTLLTETVSLVQETSKISNDYCNAESCDPRALDDWKSIYLLEPIQTGLMSTDIDLGNDEEKITKGIVSLIIESCVEFNMMREFQFVNFDQNLKGVIQKYRERLQKFLNHRNDKRKENSDTLMSEWRCDRGSAYDFKNIFMCEDEEVRNKLKQIIFYEYSIDLDNDQEKLMHLWRIILTCKQVYLGHQGSGKVSICNKEITSEEDSSSSESE